MPCRAMRDRPITRALARCARAAALVLTLSLLNAAVAVPEERRAPAAVAVFEDRDGRMTVEDVAAAGRFVPLPLGRLDAGYSRSAFWLRIEVQAAPAGGARAIVDIGPPVLDRVEAYERRSGAWQRLGIAGDGVALAERALRHRKPAFGIVPGDAPATLLVRVSSEGTLGTAVKVWDESAFLAASAEEDLFYGLYFGFLAAMLSYNLFLFGAVRDAAYFWYVSYIAALILLQAKLAGYADLYLWPAAPGWANPVNLLAFAAVLVCGAQFTKSFLGGARIAARSRHFISATQGAAALAACVLLFSYRIATQAMLLVALAFIIVLMAAMVRSYRGGYRPARFILIAFAALAPGGVAVILRALGAIGPDIPADRIFDVATAAEALLLSFALADRINAMEAERRRAEAALGSLERRFAGALLDAQESERRHMAAELHDAVGQNLVVVGNRLRALASPAAPAAVQAIEAINRETLDQVRNLARNLHPAELERLGLSLALKMMAERAVAGSGIALDLALPSVPVPMRPERTIHLYRLAQEAVTNAVKHSGARRIRLSLEPGAQGLRLNVADDGVGFVQEPAGATMGLATMRQRAALLGGDIVLSSEPGKGSSVSVLVQGEGP